MKLGQIKGSIIKHLVMNNYRPYERILKHLRERGDIWMVSQGEFFSWWLARGEATLMIIVQDGVCQVSTSLEQAAIEQFPGRFLDSLTVPCPETDFSGELWITIDSTLEEKDLLLEILKREGILNYRFAAEGEFMLSKADLDPLLEEIKTKLGERGRLFEEDVLAVRQIIINKLAARKLPLFRIWYYPRTNGVVNRAVFSPRYDVDRGITVLGRIRRLEEKYGLTSTLYIRAFCPFYTDRSVKELASKPWCSEIALHGEFTTNARRFGSEAEAAAAEKRHLEELIGRPVVGICMHGGELSNNSNSQTAKIIENIGLLYDTTQSMKYYFPFRRLLNGQLTNSYCLVHPTGDIGVPSNWAYERLFFEEVIGKMNEVYAHNGVCVVMLHPIYFGFFRYLAHPKNWGRFLSFFWRLFTKSHQIPQKQVYNG